MTMKMAAMRKRERIRMNNLVFDRKALSANWEDLINVPRNESSEHNADTEWNVDEVQSSSMRMVESILSRIDIRDMIQSNAFFDVLSQMGGDNITEETCKLELFSQHKFADSQTIPNDLNLLLTEIGCDGNMVNVLRAICAVSIVCHDNKSWKANLPWFGDDESKQIFNDPKSVLQHIYDNFVNVKRRNNNRSAMSIGSGSVSGIVPVGVVDSDFQWDPNSKNADLTLINDGKGFTKTAGHCYKCSLYSRNVLSSDEVSIARWEVTLTNQGNGGLYFCMGYIEAASIDRFNNGQDVGTKKKHGSAIKIRKGKICDRLGGQMFHEDTFVEGDRFALEFDLGAGRCSIYYNDDCVGTLSNNVPNSLFLAASIGSDNEGTAIETTKFELS